MKDNDADMITTIEPGPTYVQGGYDWRSLCECQGVFSVLLSRLQITKEPEKPKE